MRISSADPENSGILFIGFNQDHSCFAVGMQNGFRIFNCDPLKQLERHEFDVRDGTGVGYVEMLYRTSLLGILGGGHHARLPSNVACLWDGIKQQFLLEIACSSDVKAIRLRKDRIAVVLAECVKVYTFGPSPRLIYECDTCSNPLGLCHVCQNPENPLIGVPGKQFGTVLLANIGDTIVASPNALGTGGGSSMPPRQLVAHENALAALEMNPAGTLLATCSLKGTLIRVFTTRECQLVHEFRRGLNPATITSLCFNQTSDLLCVTSERGTAHIYSLMKDAQSTSERRSASAPQTNNAAPGPDTSAHEVLTNYFANASQIRCVLETKYKAVCAFSQLNPNILIVLSADGSYYKYSFTRKGAVTRVAFVNFLDFYDEDADF